MNKTKVIHLPLSKSIAARELMVDHLLFSSARERYQYYEGLYGKDLPIDIKVLGEALSLLEEKRGEEVALDCHESGTALRFLTALAALQTHPTTLHCSPRLAERPLAPLTAVYERLGAKFAWQGETLHVSPVKTRRLTEPIDATQWSSSQFASAILLTSPLLEWGTLQLKVSPDAPSFSYLKLTTEQMSERGVLCTYTDGGIRITEVSPKPYTLEPVEADWSSAAFIFQLLAIKGEVGPIALPGLKLDSHQPDAKVAEIFSKWDVQLDSNHEVLRTGAAHPQTLDLDLSQHIDLFPALAVTCAATGVPFHFRGTKTLKLKESDRITAIQEGLEALGYEGLSVGEDSTSWDGTRPTVLTQGARIMTHNDHRITMAFAILDAALDLGLHLTHRESVTKSFPNFWEQLDQVL